MKRALAIRAASVGLALVVAFGGAAYAQSDEAEALNRRIIELFQAGKAGDAVPLAERVLELRHKALPEGHPDIAQALNNLAVLYQAQGRLVEAEPLFKRALTLRELALPEGHADIASTLNNLAALYTVLGRFGEAEPLYARALAMREKALPEGHLEVGQSLNNLASLYVAQGRLGDAEPLFRRALAVSEQGLPRGHPDTARGLNNLAFLYQAQGRLAEAEPLFKRALAIFESALLAGHPDIAQSLNNLAFLYQMQGRLAEAEPLFRRVLVVSEQTLPRGHPDIARGLNNLAFLYQAQGRLAEAEPLHRRALAMREKALPTGHPDIAQSLNNLAALYQAQGRLAEAEPLYRRALAMREKALPAGHPDIARSLNNLAALYNAQGRLAEAEPLYRRTLTIIESVLPAAHPDIATALNNLAALHYARGAWAEAVSDARRAATIVSERARRAALSTPRGTGEATRGELNQQVGAPFLWLTRAAWRLAEQQPAQRAALAAESFIAAQWISQTAAGAAVSQMAARFAKGEGELSGLVREQQNLSALWQQLDALAVAARANPPEQRNPAGEAALGARLAEIDGRLLALNSRLARDFPDYAAVASPIPLSIETAQGLIQPDEALVQFGFAWDEGFAWVVTRTGFRWLRLGDTTESIRAKILALRCGVDSSAWHGDGALRCTNLLKTSLDEMPKENEPLPFDFAIAYELYDALLGQAENDIRGKHLLLVPTDALTSLAFHALVTEKPTVRQQANPAAYISAAWLARSHAVTVLPSVVSLKSVRAAAAKSPAGEAYVAFGNPLLTGPDNSDRRAWDRQTCPPRQLAQAGRLRAPPPRRFGGPVRDGLPNVEVLRLQYPLPETADEVCAVAHHLGAPERDVHLGARTAERTLKTLSTNGRLRRYRIVHFATHGLLADETESLTNSVAEPALLLTPPAQASEEDDGLLAASEVALLDLNADWVILSACNTAGGSDARGSEALSGLARAFFYAGARALLVSYWYVDSDAAVKLVTNAVAELQRDPTIGRAEALRRAMLSLTIDGSRPAGWAPAAHPAVWAPFVVVGEGRR